MSGATRNIIINELQLNKLTYYLLAFGFFIIGIHPVFSQPDKTPYQTIHGAIVRGDSSMAELALVFTGDEYADGGAHITGVLADLNIQASFFLTGKFYRNPEFEDVLKLLRKDGHYLGAHSDQHLLYCSWEDRDSLLVDRSGFQKDLLDNYKAMEAFHIDKEDALYFLPPYEWYNDSIAKWTRELGLELINYTSGTLSHTDYTLPGSRAYRSSSEIYSSILDYESKSSAGLNGFVLLVHIGTAPERTDKFYLHLEDLLSELRHRDYSFKRIDELLENQTP